MPTYNDLYSLPADKVTFDLVRDFVLAAETANLLSESLTLELKARRSGNNIAEAVAAMSNSDGGLVLVGVSEDLQGEDRFVGMSTRDLDGLVSQLHSTIPAAMPEVIPVAIPKKQLLLVVLRIDADAVLHPVVVAGKVVFRIPGAKAPADRQRILDLVARDAARTQQGYMEAPVELSGSLNRFPLWPDSDPHAAELRFVGRFLLPHRVLDQPWLGTAAANVAFTTLKESPIPGSVWDEFAGQRTAQDWRVATSRANSIQLWGRRPVQYRALNLPSADAAAYLRLVGRELSVLVGLRFFPSDRGPLTFDIRSLYAAVLAILWTIRSVGRGVAIARNVAEPIAPGKWEGWLQVADPYTVSNVLNLHPHITSGDGSSKGGWFPPAKIGVDSTDELDRLARDWITIFLLELGYRGIEEELLAVKRPIWTHDPTSK